MKKPSRPIEEGWLSYKANVVNPLNSPSQIAEMRRVFYAGAMIAATEFMAVANEEDPKKALAKLAIVSADIESFQAELGMSAHGIN